MGPILARHLLVRLTRDFVALGSAICAYYGAHLRKYIRGSQMPTDLMPLEDVVQLSPRVCRILGFCTIHKLIKLQTIKAKTQGPSRYKAPTLT